MFHASFVSSLAPAPSDTPAEKLRKQQELAKHHSQCGWLGTAWFQRLNIHDRHFVSNECFLSAVALHLSLPIAAFEGCSCTCGLPGGLTPSSAPRHIVGCNAFAKLPRSETFQTAFDAIIWEMCPSAYIEGSQPAHGSTPRCVSYASVPVTRFGVPVIDAATGLQAVREVIPDRVVRNFSDHQMGTSGRYVIDTVIPSPEVAEFLDMQGGLSSSRTPGLAAQSGYAQKFATYNNLLKPGDRLLAVSVESWGAVHDSIRDLLTAWAKALRQAGEAVCGPPAAERDTIARDILQCWRMHLSVALMHGRVDYLHAARLKVSGQKGPARSASAANEIRVSNPLRRALMLGRPGGGRWGEDDDAP